MVGRQSASVGSERPLIFGCVADSLRRRRIESSIRSVADVLWFADFTILDQALRTETRRVHVCLFDLVDPTGASGTGFARSLAQVYPGIGLVAYRSEAELTDAQLCMLGAVGVHDTLVDGLSDEGFTVRAILLDASRRGAADFTMAELQGFLPKRLHIIAEAVLRDPANGTVREIAKYLNIHRQTVNLWCRKERFCSAEELVIWCRLLFVAALLQLTNRTLDSIAIELDYASATGLRNQLKRYTGLTSTAIRLEGMSSVMDVFRGRIAQHQAGYAGKPVVSPPVQDIRRVTSVG